jgi:IPT/TIG domain/Fibronectin type III domain/Bacterial TSP3 repeat
VKPLAIILRSLCRVVVATVFGVLAVSGVAAAQSATLAWNANTETDLAGYRVEYGTVAGSPTTTVDVGNVTQRQFTGLQAGVTYYFRVRALNTSNLQSGPSAEVSYTPPVAVVPTLTSVSPTSGPAAGGTTITLAGTNFVSGATVLVNGVAATGVTFVSATQVRATTPAGSAGARTVQITNPNGQSASLAGAFTYRAAPTVTSVSPTSGPTAGGTTITVTGTAFVSGATVRVNSVAATGVTFVSATQIRAVTPAGTAGARSVQVTNPDGQSGTLASAFTYTAPASSPTLSAVSPVSGPAAGGTAVTLTGTNFAAGATVTVGGAAATGVVVVSSTRITAVTPAGTAGARDVRVVLSGGLAATLTGAFTYTAGTSTDSDGDGLTNDWETLYGLNPNSAAGVDGAAGDPDGDGLTNAAEQTAGSHPRGTLKRYLAEGVSNGFFATRFAIANPQESVARVLLTFVDTTGRVTRHYVAVPARTRSTVETSTIAALNGASFATTMEADTVVVLDRLMSWSGTAYAAHMETAVEQPATSWYLAEGATHGNFDLFYLILNPSRTAADIRIRYLRPTGSPIIKTYSVAAGSRFTIWVDQEDKDLQATDVSAEITSTNGVPIIVERSMYLNTGNKAFKGGHNSAGVTSPSLNWFLAEGSTGGFFSMYVLLANPNATAATVRMTYLLTSGAPVVKTYSVAANSRRTIDVAAQDAALADAAMSVKVESTNGVPVIVERTMWWMGSKRSWTEGHNAFGTTRTAPRWLLGEGENGGARVINTFVLIANTSAADASVRVTMLPEAGAEESVTYTVGANRRFTVPVATAFPSSDGKRFSILVESLNPSTAGALVVERATYWNTDEDLWGAGAGAVGAIIP